MFKFFNVTRCKWLRKKNREAPSLYFDDLARAFLGTVSSASAVAAACLRFLLSAGAFLLSAAAFLVATGFLVAAAAAAAADLLLLLAAGFFFSLAFCSCLTCAQHFDQNQAKPPKVITQSKHTSTSTRRLSSKGVRLFTK